MGTLLTYGWIGAGSILPSGRPRLPVSSFPIPTTAPALQRTLQHFNAGLKAAMRSEEIPGLAVAVVYQGQPVLRAGYGLTDVDRPFPVSDSTVFRLASLSKGFAAVLTGMLVDEGLLSWDDPVIKYLPDFRLKSPEATARLTLRHLLSHTTGLPRHAYSNLVNQAVPYRDIVPRLAKVPLAHQPGAWYNYQNVAYSLIGDIIEKATDRPFDSLLTERLFRPLGMRTASVGFAPMQQHPQVALPHAPDTDGYHRLEFRNTWYDVSPAAGVNASASDLSRWLELLLGRHPELISAGSLAEVISKQVDVSPREGVMRAWGPQEGECGYALGWRTVDKFGHRIVFHGGFVNGYRAEIGFCPEAQLGIAVLSNGSNHFMRNALPSFFEQYFYNLNVIR